MAKKKRLLWQLYPSYLLITLVSLVAVTWYASSSFRHLYLKKVASDLEARANLFVEQVFSHLTPLDQKSIDLLCKKIGKRASTRITVILPSGKVIGDSEHNPVEMDNHVDRPEVIQALTGQAGISIRFSRTLEESMMYVAVLLKKNDQAAVIVRTSIPVNAIDETINAIQFKIAVGGLIIAIFAAILSLLVSRRISRPIEEMKEGAEHFSQGELDHRLPVPDSEEIGGLAESMNQMAAQLDYRIKELVRQRNEQEAVLSSMVEGVIAVDMEERIININHTAAQMFETIPSEAQGRNIHEMVRNIDLQRFVTDTLSSKEPVEKDIILYSDGERILNGHGTVLHDSEGKNIGALIVLNDVTRLRKLENIRREFVANVSHEIKTPITAIKGFVETLRDGVMNDHPEEAERFFGIIENHVDRLDTIIEDLLSLSKIEQEAEREEIKLEYCLIRDLLQTAIQLCQAKADEKKINIKLICDEDISSKINPPLLEQAFINLLDNAIKYSDSGSIIKVKAIFQDTEVIISFQDQGIGIAKEHLPRLFERFYRVDRARSRKLGGTGLGLAIVKHITQAHGGHVDVESTPGKGSTFSIHLPAV